MDERIVSLVPSDTKNTLIGSYNYAADKISREINANSSENDANYTLVRMLHYNVKVLKSRFLVNFYIRKFYCNIRFSTRESLYIHFHSRSKLQSFASSSETLVPREPSKHTHTHSEPVHTHTHNLTFVAPPAGHAFIFRSFS